MTMPNMPELATERLRLRPFARQDAPVVAELVGAWEIAAMTTSIPHPYDRSMAEEWIGTHQGSFDAGEAVTFAIVRIEDRQLVGAVGIDVHKEQRSAEIGYWIGTPFWNRGYATEAAQAVIAYGFDGLALNRIQARHMTKNPASGRVMEKAGMTFEGVLRQSLYRWDAFEDAAMYSILREEYQAQEEGPGAN
jgi:ribosomal-protein-alanine N-acetyltransferase